MNIYSLEAEKSLLHSLILNNNNFVEFDENLHYSDFYEKSHQEIFIVMQDLYEKNYSFDYLLLSQKLQDLGKLESVGGSSYILGLVEEHYIKKINIKHYVKTIKDKSRLRKLLNIIEEIRENTLSSKKQTVEQVLDFAEKKIFEISQIESSLSNDVKHVKTIIEQVLDKIDAINNADGGITGLETGFKDLDKKTFGLQNSNLIIIAGRPSMGKTTFGMNIAEYVSRNNEKPVLIFSLEMPSSDIVMRMMSSISNVEQEKIKSGNLNDNDWENIGICLDVIGNSKMLIDDSSVLTPSQVRSKSRKAFKENNGLSLIIIDYLQLMSCYGSENRVQEIAEISRSLKSLAKELQIPVIALSQLNRSVESRSDKRPMMSDIRESGSIEQDADLIMFVYRDSVYNKNEINNKNAAEIIIGKHRNGEIGTINLEFQGAFCKFANKTSFNEMNEI